MRIQLLGVLLLLRCICEASTLLSLFPNHPGNGCPQVPQTDQEQQESLATHVSTALLFYVFVFLEDGQGLLTFLLFAMQPPTPPPRPPSPTSERHSRASNSSHAAHPWPQMYGTHFGSAIQGLHSARIGIHSASPH